MINRRVITITLVIANLCLFVIFVSGWVNPIAQNRKTILRRLTLSKEPIDISFTLKGQPLNTSDTVRREEGIRAQEFDADLDWLRDLTLKVRNTSEKTITYIALNLHFPEVTKNGRTALQQVFIGIDPDRKFQRPELRLAPNETIEVPLAARYDGIETLIRAGNSRIENVGKLWLEFQSAFFDDGTLFEAGTLYRRNPDQNDPHNWIKIDNR